MRKRAKININNNFKKELQKYSNSFIKGIAQKVKEELIQTAFNAIVRFYTSWSPKYYERHYYNFMDYSFKGYYKNPHNMIVRGGVELTPYRMRDIYEDPTQEVFDLVYQGFHGMAGITNPNIPRMNPSPIQLLYLRRDNIVKNISIYEKYGYGNSGGNYNTFTTY